VHDKGVDLLNTETGEVILNGKESNLQDLQPGINAIAADARGRLWIGAGRGLVVYRADPNRRNAMPRPVIRRVTMLTGPWELAGGARLQHDEHDVGVDFSVVWYKDPGSLQHAYLLEPFHHDWIVTSDKRIIFSSLPPGEYRLRLRSAEYGRFDGAAEASFSFAIDPPFWRRLWFQALFVAVATALVLIYLRQRDRRTRKIEALKKEKIEFQFETLKSQVNPHFLFNSFNTLISVIEQDKKLAVEYVEQLSDFYRNLVQFRDKELITLNEEIGLAKAYFEIQKKRFGPNLILNIHAEERRLAWHVPPMVVQILLENAIKHNAVSAQSPLTIDVYTQENRLVVKNTLNPKKTIEPSTGTGLHNVKNRYQLLTRDSVQVEQDKYFFTVSLPLIKS
jgi:hypothetical protein